MGTKNQLVQKTQALWTDTRQPEPHLHTEESTHPQAETAAIPEEVPIPRTS